ncbi:MAG: methyltransferase [Desulfobacterales bacterium]|jgi:ubiquinone/menaquinone biosynthesis C-methylase UbiE
MKPSELPPHAQIMQFIAGKWISKPIYVAAELGIADMLSDGAKSVDELAEMTGAQHTALYRLMRALACVGIFSETGERCFALTPMAECLKRDAMRSIALMFLSDWHDKAWDCLLDSVKTGDIAFEKAHGKPAFEWFKDNRRAAELYYTANAIKARGSHRAIVDAYDFSDITTLTDVGGGYGTLMVEILMANPHIQGVVADLASVARIADKEIKAKNLDPRCRVMECDFFKEIPAGSDAYLLSHVLHDWDDEQCRRILKNCRRAMTPGAKLLILESVIATGNEFSIAKLLDLEVFVMGGGRERSEAEFRELFESVGFILSQVVATSESVSVIEGIRS